MHDFDSPIGWHALSVWLPVLVVSAVASLGCFRRSIPLLLAGIATHCPRKWETNLPLNGRWLRLGAGALVLLVGLTLAAIAGTIATCGTFALLGPWFKTS